MSGPSPVKDCRTSTGRNKSDVEIQSKSAQNTGLNCDCNKKGTSCLEGKCGSTKYLSCLILYSSSAPLKRMQIIAIQYTRRLWDSSPKGRRKTMQISTLLKENSLGMFLFLSCCKGYDQQDF